MTFGPSGYCKLFSKFEDSAIHNTNVSSKPVFLLILTLHLSKLQAKAQLPNAYYLIREIKRDMFMEQIHRIRHDEAGFFVNCI